MIDSVFKPPLGAAGAEVFGCFFPLPKADFCIQARHRGHATGLAEARSVGAPNAAVVARGELAREEDIALGVFLVAFPQSRCCRRKKDVYALVDYLPQAALL